MENRTVSIIIPTINEVDNIRRIIEKLVNIARGNPTLGITEIVIVDDKSTDGTQQVVEKLTNEISELSLILLERNRKLGLLSAQIDGASIAKGEKVIMMDGDLQHPVDIIPNLIINSRGRDLVIASRYNGGKSVRLPLRGLISRAATFICHVALPTTVRVKDPLSGFFIVRRKYVSGLKGGPVVKIKLLPYLIAKYRELAIFEVPYCFVERENGHSKIVDRKFKFVFQYLFDVFYMMKVSKESRHQNTPNYVNGFSQSARVQKKEEP